MNYLKIQKIRASQELCKEVFTTAAFLRGLRLTFAFKRSSMSCGATAHHCTLFGGSLPYDGKNLGDRIFEFSKGTRSSEE